MKLTKKQKTLLENYVRDSQLSAVSRYHYIKTFAELFNITYPGDSSPDVQLRYIRYVADFLLQQPEPKSNSKRTEATEQENKQEEGEE